MKRPIDEKIKTAKSHIEYVAGSTLVSSGMFPEKNRKAVVAAMIELRDFAESLRVKFEARK